MASNYYKILRLFFAEYQHIYQSIACLLAEYSAEASGVFNNGESLHCSRNRQHGADERFDVALVVVLQLAVVKN
jgi:hypothetical protein